VQQKTANVPAVGLTDWLAKSNYMEVIMKSVTLTHDDIAAIAHEMNIDWFGDSRPPSQGALEWLLCVKIRALKSVDFIKEQGELQKDDAFEHVR
jgi:hypothetical protein